ncbi:FxSxx-COOH system tetratricopeptide repeat protein [Nonomuraea sp. NPDC049400]|uniref:FxSxx-COOH system tetratricopeptide repeat protein n=1 Tax=Nonomuraea sp. NPDC049400 TaxID=3364352 RepID=UPI0037AACDB0
MRDQLVAASSALISQPAQALFGLGGVGKTEIAAEYAHRWASDYEVIWWVRAEQEHTIRNSIVALGRRMGLQPDLVGNRRDYSSQAVLDALRLGEPYRTYLLVFDNAMHPELVRKYLPQGAGHVIITSRLQNWRQALRSDGIQVAQFTLGETVEFLRKRVPALAPGEDAEEEAGRQAAAEELANTLGNLPLAAEHAAAYLTQTGATVKEYIERFHQNAHLLFGENVDIYYPDVVATTWSVSRERISEEADALFGLLAFFSPEPISEALIAQPGRVPDLPGPLSKVIHNLTDFRRAARELARFSLIQIDGMRNIVQIHRVVQAVTKSRIEQEDPERARELRDAVHALLAASNPGEPELEENDTKYERSRQHLIPSGALDSDNSHLRNLVIQQVRRLAIRGGNAEALALGGQALERWQVKLGPDHLQVLSLAAEVASVLRELGRYQEAYERNAETVERARRVLGEENEVYLRCARSLGTDLRILGRYNEVLDLEMQLLPLHERVLRPEHRYCLIIRNNIALSLRCLGRFEEALEWDEHVRAERERLYGHDHLETLDSWFAVARDYRRLGRYEDSLDYIREVTEAMARTGQPWHRRRLLAEADLAVALRRMGFHAQAREQAEEVLERHRALLGAEHRQSLLVATNTIIDRKLTDDLAAAQDLGEQTVKAWEQAAGAGHPNILAAKANLATVLRHRRNPLGARQLNEDCLAGFTAAFGELHVSPLVVMTNLASDLAALGEVRQARELGEQVLRLAKQVLHERHPVTLAAMSNLALDRRAVGEPDAADELFQEAMEGYRESQLSLERWDARQAMQRGRLDVDIEPMSF